MGMTDVHESMHQLYFALCGVNKKGRFYEKKKKERKTNENEDELCLQRIS
uniref:Uncharacterized protein n=1 Tax=Arundo donax TaxID=35708 RepID=A0A0A8XS18_ARUDO